jgi:multidrug efflux pump
VKEAEKLFDGDEGIATYTGYVGQGSPRFWLGLNPQLPNEAFAEIVIVAKDVEARERIKAKIENAVADGALPQARVRVDRFNFGPPVGFPVQFRVIGPVTGRVREIAYQVRDIVKQNPNVKDPQLDWNEQSPYLKLVVDQDRARALGLTPQDVSQALSMLISGAQVTTVRDGIEKVGVVARAVAGGAARSRPCR